MLPVQLDRMPCAHNIAHADKIGISLDKLLFPEDRMDTWERQVKIMQEHCQEVIEDHDVDASGLDPEMFVPPYLYTCKHRARNRRKSYHERIPHRKRARKNAKD